jgi:Fe-S oxidoreductase
VEPSVVFTFRDEYPDLATKENQEAAQLIAKSTFMIDEFMAAEIAKGNISKELFSKEKKQIKLHGHCHQKSLASVEPTIKMLSLPENYTVEEIKSGCCGMAGSFGYEKNHYELSMKIGELILFPEIRKSESSVIIAAPGISCRQQIKHGTGIDVSHPVEIFYDALI